MADSEFIKLNIAIRPPESVFRVARKFSGQCPGSTKSFSLDAFRIPHITLYYVEFPAKNLDEILKATEKICKSTKAFDMIFTKAAFAYDYFFAYFEKTPELLELHNKLLAELNPLREGHLKEKYIAGSLELAELSEAEQGNVLKYGHLNCGSTFNPHLTITHYDEHKHPKLNEMPKLEFDTFPAESVIIFTGGEFGTTEKIIQEIKLTSQ